MKYIKYDYFVSLIENKKLRFSSISSWVEDGYDDEGYLTPKTREILESISSEFSNKIRETAINKSELDSYTWKGGRELFQSLVYASSWTMDTEESDLMWNEYAGNNGVIIKSSDKDLEASILSEMEGYRFLIVYKPVEYHNDHFIDTPTSADTHYFIKSTKSKKDNEFRARIIAEKQGENINMPVDLNTLIKGVIVHPSVNLKKVQKFLDTHEVKVNAVYSKLLH